MLWPLRTTPSSPFSRPMSWGYKVNSRESCKSKACRGSCHRPTIECSRSIHIRWGWDATVYRVWSISKDITKPMLQAPFSKSSCLWRSLWILPVIFLTPESRCKCNQRNRCRGQYSCQWTYQINHGENSPNVPCPLVEWTVVSNECDSFCKGGPT